MQNKFLTDRTKKINNLYFVTCMCTLTTRIDIFQRFFVMFQKTFLLARTRGREPRPPSEPVPFLKDRTPFRPLAFWAAPTPPVLVPALKVSHLPALRHMASRGTTYRSHNSVTYDLFYC